jgi:membrane-associated protease RseP (regulator of RpoE activity)
MKHFSRPCKSLGFAVAMGVGAWLAMAPAAAPAQVRGIVQLIQEPSRLLLHSNSQGYLGVDLADVDQDKAQTLKLKEVRGAIVTLIDHDAPAGRVGLKVNDVVMKLNGQAVEGAEQLRRMLREIPAGRKVSLEVSRDGAVQTLVVELADRRAMEHDVWNKIGNGGDVFAQAPGMGILAGGEGSLPSGFHMPFFGSTLNVGALVEPLTSQMAEYMGVPSGLMIRQVARKSEAANAGLKAFDVILKVGTESITTMADWDRSLRANEGKPVQVTVLRDKKQQTLTLQVDSKHHGELYLKELFPDGEGMALAEVEQDLAGDAAAEAMRQQAEELQDSLKGEEFKLDPKQMEEMKRQMEEFRKNFKPEEFKLDPSLRFHLDVIPNIEEKLRREQERQMDQLKRQMEEMKALGFGNHA